MSTSIVTIGSYNDESIFYDAKTDMVDATALWRACGSPENKRPVDYLELNRTKELIEAIAENLKSAPTALLKKKSGRYGGSYFYRHLALDYTMYLSPKMHAQVLKWQDLR